MPTNFVKKNYNSLKIEMTKWHKINFDKRQHLVGQKYEH